MTHQDFFHRLAAQYAMRLPFVAYRKPKNENVQVIFQNDNQLHKVDDYSESGFLMAPFLDNQDTLLIPGTALNAAIDLNDLKISHKPVESKGQDPEDYMKLVTKAVDEICKTNLKKVVLSRKQTFPNTQEPIALFRKLLVQYPEAFTYLWYHPKAGIWIGASPETLLEISGSQFKTMALAGTQKYEGNEDPKWEQKELDEQQLVVDEIIKNLESLGIKNYSTANRKSVRAGKLMHLQTELRGILSAGNQVKDLITSLHPTPAVCGFPREMAKEFIIANENYDRAYYSGYLGEINQTQEQNRSKNRRNVENLAYKSLKNTTNLYVNLRCMEYDQQEVNLYMGAGITAGSHPLHEWQETCAKAQTMLQVLQKD